MLGEDLIEDGMIKSVAQPSSEIKKEISRPSTIKIKAYPNPFSGEVNFRISGDYVKGSRLLILDIYGKTLTDLPVKNGITTIDLSKFSTGIYLYQMISPDYEVLDFGKIISK
ncbi:MAG: hypothetical protein ACI9N1_000152 [Flavobacteriales bacterium]